MRASAALLPSAKRQLSWESKAGVCECAPVAGGHCLEKPLALLEAAAYMHTPHSLHTWLNGFYPLGSNLIDIRMAALQVRVPARVTGLALACMLLYSISNVSPSWGRQRVIECHRVLCCSVIWRAVDRNAMRRSGFPSAGAFSPCLRNYEGKQHRFRPKSCTAHRIGAARCAMRCTHGTDHYS